MRPENQFLIRFRGSCDAVGSEKPFLERFWGGCDAEGSETQFLKRFWEKLKRSGI